MKQVRGWSRVSASLLGVVLLAMLAGCATMAPNYEPPVVSLSYFRPAESGSGFDIGLKILNPNSSTLNLEGVVYTIRLQGQDLVKGVGKGFEPIEAYSEGDVQLSAAPNLLGGIRLLGELMSQKDEQLNWEFEAKLDVGSLYPRIKVRETGSLQLKGADPQ